MNEKTDHDIKSFAPRIVAAAASADMETVKTLVASGTDINSTDSEGRTALIAAAAESYFAENPPQFARYASIIKFLIESGADTEIRDKNGHTAADHAYLSNEIENIIAKNAGGAKL